MLKQISVGLVVICSLLMGCSLKEKERPSPLRTDSTIFNTNQLVIQFGSPSVKERVIWGDLVPYDKMWRTGANEATRFYTSGQLKIDGMKLDSGTYALLTIPRKNSWEIIFNEDHEQWGTYDYDQTLDVFRLNVVTRNSNEYSEQMKFYFEHDSLKFHWVNLKFSLAFE